MANLKEIADELAKVPPTLVGEFATALENDIQQAQKAAYPNTILSPKEYGMKLRKRKR